MRAIEILLQSQMRTDDDAVLTMFPKLESVPDYFYRVPAWFFLARAMKHVMEAQDKS
jgi:hypothetical protein